MRALTRNVLTHALLRVELSPLALSGTIVQFVPAETHIPEIHSLDVSPFHVRYTKHVFILPENEIDCSYYTSSFRSYTTYCN